MKLQLRKCSGIVFFLFIACCHEVEEETFVFSIESVSPLNFNHTTIEFISEDNQEISASSYAMVLETTAPSVRNAAPQKRGGGIFRSPDCGKYVDPQFLLEDPVAAVKVTATKDFSQAYPAGSDLSELFSPFWITKDNPFSTPPSLIENIPGGINIQDLNRVFIRYHDAVDYRNQKLSSFYGLKLIERPSVPVLLQFKVELFFQSGRTVSGFTNSVLVK